MTASPAKLAAVTIIVPELAAARHVFAESLGYRSMPSDTLSEEAARAWGAPNAAGSATALLAAPSPGAALLRLVERPPVWEYAPLKSHGWACIEILAKDPDTLARTLPDRGFQVIGPPNDLPGQPGVRAMQAIGPGGVCYYFTRVGPEGVAAGLPQARAQIDRVFVIVLGASSLETSIDFYCRTLDAARPQTMPARISVLSRAHELDPETRHNLAVIVLDQFFIEIDQYPTSATARPTHPSDLAPGFSFPSFMVDGVATRSPYACDLFGYEGYKATIVIGPDGEILELLSPV